MRFVVKVKQVITPSPRPGASLVLRVLSHPLPLLRCTSLCPVQCSTHPRFSEDTYWPIGLKTVFQKTVTYFAPNCEVGPVFRATSPQLPTAELLFSNLGTLF